MRRTLFLTTFVALAGCSQIAEPRVRSALIDAGLSERNADCMASRMVDRLTLSQLQRLEALSGQNRETLGQLSLADYVALVRRVGDAEVLAVTASSAALCATGIAS
ncbi:hypothetical protein [Sphingomonas baiyangensis]|uniref:Lipoprotein n=1 Tax=Sphingomonas baiyangensis TaxID=2572576 RepID=A0A4U1L7J0_9SPHN|nr:hypothetical protein [Sphingomonas baiyangensis]TKD52891.1 hypothetical protein FBR43_00615 [Sphingomonas baiyangensis]